MATPTAIRLNLLPAQVIVLENDAETRRYPRTRAIVSEDTIYGYIDTFDGPALEFEYRLEDFSGDNRTGWTAETSEGLVLKISRADDCLCGSRLRGFDPFPGVPYIGYS